MMISAFWRLRFQIIKNGVHRERKNRFLRVLFFSVIGVSFWLAVFILFYRVLMYFKGIEILGDILAIKLLYMIIVTFFCLLIMSGLLLSLSKYFLARDLSFVYSLPISSRDIFLARFLEVVVNASWMVILYSLPIFISYGLVYGAGISFYLTFLISIILLCLIACGLSSVLVLLFGASIPAGKMRSGLSLLSILVVVAIIVTVRILRPEQLVNPDQFMTVALYLSAINIHPSPLLPTTWVYESMQTTLRGGPVSSILLDLGLAITCAGSLISLGASLAEKNLHRSFVCAETVLNRPIKRAEGKVYKLFPSDMAALFTKEWKFFSRDQSQWPQLILILILIGLYLYNFSVLPLDKTPIQSIYLQNVFAFLNLGLSAFVLTALSARFVFPAVSWEGKAFWIVSSSPIDLGRYLWIKYLFYLIPLLFLSEILVISSNMLLGVTPFMMVVSAFTVFFLVAMVTALALAFGAIYPAFDHENPLEAVTSLGGILYMIASAVAVAVVIVFEAGPVYRICMASLKNEHLHFWEILWMFLTFASVAVLSFVTVVASLKVGKKKLSMMN